jgi:hypothetical protein
MVNYIFLPFTNTRVVIFCIKTLRSLNTVIHFLLSPVKTDIKYFSIQRSSIPETVLLSEGSHASLTSSGKTAHVDEDEYGTFLAYYLLQGKTEVLGGKPVPALLCPTQTLHGLAWDRIRPPR